MSKKILIVEDAPMIGQDLQLVIESMGYEVIAIEDNAEDAIHTFKTQSPDLVFMDVQLNGEKDGIEIAKEISNIKDTPIIFLTSYFDDHTVHRIRQQNPAAYIVKPFKDSDIRVNLGLALIQNEPTSNSQSTSTSESEELFVRKNGDLKRIHFDEIQWIKGEDNYSIIKCENGESFTITQTLKKIHEKIEHKGFIRIQKSYVVRLSSISSISGNTIQIGDEIFPIGKAYRKDFFQKITVL